MNTTSRSSLAFNQEEDGRFCVQVQSVFTAEHVAAALLFIMQIVGYIIIASLVLGLLASIITVVVMKLKGKTADTPDADEKQPNDEEKV